MRCNLNKLIEKNGSKKFISIEEMIETISQI